MKVAAIITRAANLRTSCAQHAVLLAKGTEWRQVVPEIRLPLILHVGNFDWLQFIRISNIKITEVRLSWWPIHGTRSNKWTVRVTAHTETCLQLHTSASESLVNVVWLHSEMCSLPYRHFSDRRWEVPQFCLHWMCVYMEVQTEH